jgi:hypothetical protein
MRQPLDKFPKRPSGPDDLRRQLAECEAMLAKPRLSPEMRLALKEKTSQLREQLAGIAEHRARAKSQDRDEKGPSEGRGRH